MERDRLVEAPIPDEWVIDPKRYAVDSFDFPIAEGIDSKVYLGEEIDGRRWIMKLYWREGDLLRLRGYQRVTARAASILDGRKVDIEGLEEVPEMEWKVQPIDQIGYIDSKEGRRIVCGISEYVPGKHLDTVTRDVDYEMGIFGSINRFMMQETMNKVARWLNRELGCRGIRLVHVNVKPVGNGLIITDLCSDLHNFVEY